MLLWEKKEKNGIEKNILYNLSKVFCEVKNRVWYVFGLNMGNMIIGFMKVRTLF